MEVFGVASQVDIPGGGAALTGNESTATWIANNAKQQTAIQRNFFIVFGRVGLNDL